jgi:hypothetical protein
MMPAKGGVDVFRVERGEDDVRHVIFIWRIHLRMRAAVLHPSAGGMGRLTSRRNTLLIGQPPVLLRPKDPV